ncbi:hypothetical protein OH818_28430 (plasmid) [Jiella pelagia]|uniref:Uncharacterized protein n=1 Tax=Jiella pelagia TaxID=2986949 RepID=A0ABY7C7U6_9HYPH|nr:hypothetical protein OH818_28430 [Jiella pelagia]
MVMLFMDFSCFDVVSLRGGLGRHPGFSRARRLDRTPAELGRGNRGMLFRRLMRQQLWTRLRGCCRRLLRGLAARFHGAHGPAHDEAGGERDQQRRDAGDDQPGPAEPERCAAECDSSGKENASVARPRGLMLVPPVEQQDLEAGVVLIFVTFQTLEWSDGTAGITRPTSP